MSKLDDFETKLNAALAKQEEKNPTVAANHSREMNLGIRAFMEMLGVLLGSGLMGWSLDRFFGISPILLITFVILGIVAAFLNLYKLSRNLGTAIGSNRLQSEEKDANKPSKIEL